jgi:hypothetical protein
MRLAGAAAHPDEDEEEEAIAPANGVPIDAALMRLLL